MQVFPKMGLVAIAGSIVGTVLGIWFDPSSAAVWAGVGTALGAGIGLLFTNRPSRKNRVDSESCGFRSRREKDTD